MLHHCSWLRLQRSRLNPCQSQLGGRLRVRLLCTNQLDLADAEPCDIQIGAIHGEAEKETINFSPVELLFVGATTEEPKIEIDLKPRAPWPLEVSAKTMGEKDQIDCYGQKGYLDS